MSGILDDFKDAFSKRNNGLIQLIWLNVAVYVVMLILWIGVNVAFSSDAWFETIRGYISLKPALNIFLFRPWTILTYAFIHSVSPLL
jgi:membrane associated rhomboid family serine protease